MLLGHACLANYFVRILRVRVQPVVRRLRLRASQVALHAHQQTRVHLLVALLLGTQNEVFLRVEQSLSRLALAAHH